MLLTFEACSERGGQMLVESPDQLAGCVEQGAWRRRGIRILMSMLIILKDRLLVTYWLETDR